jgi:hypothetical protein
MVKLLVDVFTPGNGKTYEFQLDGAMSVGRATTQIISGILKTENDAIAIDPKTAVLSDATAAMRLSEELSLTKAGVKSGHRLILV